MYPSPAVAARVLERAQGRCECSLSGCGHGPQCGETLAEPSADGSPVCFVSITAEFEDADNWYAFCPTCLRRWQALMGTTTP